MFPWEQPGEKQWQQHICCSCSWSPSQREGFGSTGFSRSSSVDEQTSPVLRKLLWLQIATRPLQIYLAVKAALEHLWEHQKKMQWKKTIQPFYPQWWWTLRKIYRRIQIHRKLWNLVHAQTVYTRPFFPPLLNYYCGKGLGTRLYSNLP